MNPHHLDLDLQSWSKGEAGLWNWYCSTMPTCDHWRQWMQEEFAQLLEKPAGHRVYLVQTQSVESPEKEQRHTFSKVEVCLGRDAGNDMVLSASSVSKRHAHVFLRNGLPFLEDLGSRMGTYVNKKKLTPNEPILLRNGDGFSLFPYNFVFSYEQLWLPESEVQVTCGEFEAIEWDLFVHQKPRGHRSFGIVVHPLQQAVSLDVNTGFLEDVVERLLRPAGIELTRKWLMPSDTGLLEFLLLSLLDRVNQQLAFPFQLTLDAGWQERGLGALGRGIGVPFSVGLSQSTGSFRVFLPFDLLDGMRRTWKGPQLKSDPVPISWKFQVSLGKVDLSLGELQQVEQDDVVMMEPVCELLFPNDPQGGWEATLVSRDPWTFRVGRYFERSLLMESLAPVPDKTAAAGEPGAKPDFTRLPFVLHAIVGEKELTLAEANGLALGTIVALEKESSAPVDLAINGKVCGKGQLVEIEGKLGVKILSWRI